MNLFSSSHFYHHVEAPFVGALLKLPTFETFMDFTFLELSAIEALYTSEPLAMEMNTKGSGWGRGQQDEGRRWARVGRSFPKKNLGSRVGHKI